MEVVNLEQKLSLFSDYWNPRIVGDLNGQQVKLAKIQGEFVWHSHAGEDELFLILKGTLQIEFRDRTLTLHEGEFVIVPRGVEHRPVAAEEVHLLLFEPVEIKHTGDVQSHLTVENFSRI